jgi:hypothetical protein
MHAAIMHRRLHQQLEQGMIALPLLSDQRDGSFGPNYMLAHRLLGTHVSGPRR